MLRFPGPPMFLFTFLCLLVLLAVWVSLPLLPAILIYRLFPNAPLIVSGPLAGLTVKTGGAFGAYLIIFLLIKSQIDTTKDFIGSAMRSYWQITGEVSLLDESGKEIDALDQVLQDVRTRPSTVTHDGATLSFKIPEDKIGHVPKVVLYFPHGSGWAPLNLEDLDDTAPWWKFWKWFDHKPTIDPFLKTIDIGKVSIARQTRTPTSNSTIGMEKGTAPAATR
jgi:hypothetical protein